MTRKWSILYVICLLPMQGITAYGDTSGIQAVICSRDLRKMEAALKDGLDPNAIFSDGWAKGYTPLTLALAEIDCHAGVNLGLVTLLVEKGADVNKPASIYGGTTPLMESARSLDVQSVEYLLQKGADANAIDVDGRTALMQFSGDGSDRPRKIVEALLRAGADARIKSKKGLTAEIWATELRRPDIAEIIRNAAEKQP